MACLQGRNVQHALAVAFYTRGMLQTGMFTSYASAHARLDLNPSSLEYMKLVSTVKYRSTPYRV